MDGLDGIMLSKVKSDIYDFTYKYNLKKKKDKHNKTERVIDTENKQVVARWEGGRGGKKIDEGDKRCKLPVTK